VHGELQVEVDEQWLINVDRDASQEHVEVIAGDKAQWVLMVTDDRGRCINDCDRSFRVRLEPKQATGRSMTVDKELRMMEDGRLRFECTCATKGEYELVVVDHSDNRIVVGSATVSPGPLHTFMVVETEAMKNSDKGTTDHWLEVRLQSLDAYGNRCPCPEGCKLEAAAIFSPNALQGTTEGDVICRRPLVPTSGKSPSVSSFSARLEWQCGDTKTSNCAKVHGYFLECVKVNGKTMPLSFAKNESPVVEKANKVQQAKQKEDRLKKSGSTRWSLAWLHRRTSSVAPSDGDQDDEFEKVDLESTASDSCITDSETMDGVLVGTCPRVLRKRS
jgi:hypothetical protein